MFFGPVLLSPFHWNMHILCGEEKKKFQLAAAGCSSRVFCPFELRSSFSSLHEAATTVGTRAALLPKDCVAPLKSSPTAKSHGGTFCLVLLQLHSSLPRAPRSPPVCCRPSIGDCFVWMVPDCVSELYSHFAVTSGLPHVFSLGLR